MAAAPCCRRRATRRPSRPRSPATHAGWLTIAGGASGFGSGTVSVAAAPNTTGTPRDGTLVVAGHPITVTQDACAFTATPDTIAIGATGGTASVTVQTSVGCGWTATSNASWLSITSGTSGFGSGTVGVAVAPHVGVETLTVAGRTVTVTQAAP